MSHAARSADPGSDGESYHPDLWRLFRERGDLESRNALVIAYRPLAARAARRMPDHVRSYWEMGDLVSFGVLGLIDAIDRWDGPGDDGRFTHYALSRARGSIFDNLRLLDWLPRTVRRRITEFRNAEDELTGGLRRTARPIEVLELLGVPDDRRSEVLAEVNSSQLLHLEYGEPATDFGDDGEGSRLLDRLVARNGEGDPEERLLRRADRDELQAAIASLPERERCVVELVFQLGLTQVEAAAVMGVSDSRICQIKRDAKRRLLEIMNRSTRAGQPIS